MIIDGLSIPDGTVIDSEICIVGAGAAGITLAKEFMGTSHQVCLLESGGLEVPEQLTKVLSDGNELGLSYAKHVRCCRSLGGNTNLWGSWCRPLDESDFESRPWIPYSGWPFTKEELIPYYYRAQKICQIGEFENYNPRHLIQTLGFGESCLLPFNQDKLVTKAWQMARPELRFGKAYRCEIETAKHIYTYLHANVVEIETNDTARTVTKVRVACINGTNFSVTAKIFILAMGGIENPRLLLASNQVQSNGLGNQHDVVGRFFMERPHLYGSGSLFILKSEHYPVLYTLQAIDCYGILLGLGLSKDFQEKEKLLSYSAVLLPTPFPLTFKILNILEQAPDPANRITLTQERDRFGVNTPKLDLQLSFTQKDTILRSQQVIDEELRRTKLGTLQIELSQEDDSWSYSTIISNTELVNILEQLEQVKLTEEDDYNSWPPSTIVKEVPLVSFCHQIGATRMHVDPKQGVVDENCRVHGISNLYIAGSSVFPTAGSANPTLTIVALAIRLADHIKKIYRESSYLPFFQKRNFL
ncbi:MAG: GMC family oxidoreductase [Nostoc sp.]|uniref:GMC family oxidoreductase n=1 Tax=Nostoc sp. TaxID=1180 RepID=UPI002FF1B21B